MEHQKNYTRKTNPLILSGILGLVFSFPVTGFIYGVFACKDCGNGASGIIGRAFIGLVEAVLTTITFGAPWDNEGGSTSTNLRVYVLITFLILSILFYLKQRAKQKR
jgi:hypothetical protein